MSAMPAMEKYRVVVVISPGMAAPWILSDLAAAFAQGGSEIFIIDLRELEKKPSTQEKLAYFEDITAALIRFSPHFALGYNTSVFISLPPNNPRAHFFEALQIPYISLFFDNPLLSGYANAILTPESSLYTVFIWDRHYLDLFRSSLRKEAFYLPLATNPEVFKPDPADAGYTCDLSFVGSVSEETDYAKGRKQAGWHEWLVGFAENVVQTKQANPHASIEQVIAAFQQTFPQQTQEILSAYLRSDASSDFMLSLYAQLGDQYRLEVMDSLTEFKPHIFGGKGWERMRRGGAVLEGSTAYGAELSRIYRKSRINLNISSVQLMDSVNQRVFDVPASGAFLLTDARAQLGTLFELGFEMVTYASVEELRKHVRYYLEHDEERQDLAQNARRRVLAEHTYFHRAASIIAVLKDKGLID